MDNRNIEQYLSRNDLHENFCIHHCISRNKFQIAALDVAKLSSQDPQVGHGLWRLLTLQIFYQFVEVANNFSHKIFRNLGKKNCVISKNDNSD